MQSPYILPIAHVSAVRQLVAPAVNRYNQVFVIAACKMRRGCMPKMVLNIFAFFVWKVFPYVIKVGFGAFGTHALDMLYSSNNIGIIPGRCRKKPFGVPSNKGKVIFQIAQCDEIYLFIPYISLAR